MRLTQKIQSKYILAQNKIYKAHNQVFELAIDNLFILALQKTSYPLNLIYQWNLSNPIQNGTPSEVDTNTIN